ncbi:hypothetical protein BY996DRAFT_8693989 [Phakopsora pachyrhizi]|nr:hypothetical protein BY996DRAFT_8693989 [Phakopsora pachyrhizi]
MLLQKSKPFTQTWTGSKFYSFELGEHQSIKANSFITVKSQEIRINVQHHCAGAKCLIRRTLPRRLERQETDMMLKEVHDNYNFNLYVINTASLREQDEHHAPARIPLPPIQPLDVLNAVHNGLSEWKKKARTVRVKTKPLRA